MVWLNSAITCQKYGIKKTKLRYLYFTARMKFLKINNRELLKFGKNDL